MSRVGLPRYGWLTAGLACLVSGAASGQIDRHDWRLEYPTQTFDAAGLEFLELVNPWGDVRVRGEDVEEILMSLAVQRHRDDPRSLDLGTEPTASGLRIRVGFDDSLEVVEHVDWAKRRIDLALVVPSHLMTDIRTTSGRVEIDELHAPTRVTTQSGDVLLRLRADAEAASDYGDIRAIVLAAEEVDSLALTTETGDLRVELPEGTGATVEIETTGRISTDYSMQIDRQPGSRRKRGRARIGDGRIGVSLRSEKGAAELVALITSIEDLEATGPNSHR